MSAESINAVGLGYYHPINQRQAEFHASAARNKLLIGGYGAGKTYPTIHAVLEHCFQNPGHIFLVSRNTWDNVEDEIQEDYLRICKAAGIMKKFIADRGKNAIILINDCKIIFRPLTLKRAKLKGLHICGFHIDDPDVGKYSDTISFLWSRMRNPPDVKATSFKSWITANWEGRNWLWKVWMRDRPEGGDGDDIIVRGGKEQRSDLAYWVCPTNDNPTLPDTFIPDMAAVHSEEWMDRYVYCTDLSANIGLVYHNFNSEIHHKPAEEVLKKKGLIKITSTDLGITHKTCILKMATDGRAIYIYDEIFRKGLLTGDVGKILRSVLAKDTYFRNIIDPASAKKDQTSGVRPKDILRKEYGIPLLPGNNAVVPGIQIVNDLIKPSIGPPRLYVDIHRCPNLFNQLETYRWQEPPNMDYDDLDYKEEPVKKDDDAVDSMRYGVVFLKKFLKIFAGQIAQKNAQRAKNREKRAKKLPFYKKYSNTSKHFDLIQTYKSLGFSPKKIKRLISAIN